MFRQYFADEFPSFHFFSTRLTPHFSSISIQDYFWRFKCFSLEFNKTKSTHKHPVTKLKTKEVEKDTIVKKAFEYWQNGLNVIPVKGKKPLVNWKKWQTERQSKEVFEKLCWNKSDGFALIGGSQTENGDCIAAIDLDIRGVSKEIVEKGKEVIERLQSTQIERTPSGGLHLIFWSQQKPKTIGIYRKATGLELLGENKLIIMAPSQGYAKLNDKSPAVVQNLEETFQEALRDAGIMFPDKGKAWFDGKNFKGKRYRGKHPSCIVELLKGVQEGQRNETCIRLASYFLNLRGVKRDRALAILKEWNEKNHPPLAEEEIAKTLKSAQKNQYVYGCNDSIFKGYCKDKGNCSLHKSSSSKTRDRQQSKGRKNFIKCVSFLEHPDGRLCEEAFDGEETFFLVYDPEKDEVAKTDQIELGEHIFQPIDNDEVRSGTVLLPSGVNEYGSLEQLIKELEEYFDSWYDSPDELAKMQDVAYCFLTYVQDLVPQVPYNRRLGDWGKGKTTWLDVVGSVCYRPISLAGSDTDKSIVRTLHNWRGTALIDEADFSNSNLYSFIVKILNVGYDRKKGWYRRSKEKDPYGTLQYYAYGCKLLATRTRYKDMALESRCLTNIGRENIKEVPLFRLEKFDGQALLLRNKLTLWRFRNYSRIKEESARLEDKHLSKEVYGDSKESRLLSSRVKQIILPLWLIGNEHLQSKLIELAKKINTKLKVQDWKYMLELEAREAIKTLWAEDQERLQLEIDDSDKGMYEREGKSIRKANLIIQTLEIEGETFHTIPLSVISKKIISLKGVSEDEIERKDVISYSKSLKNLFEARLGFDFQIGSKNTRVVLVPSTWLKNIIESDTTNEQDSSSSTQNAVSSEPSIKENVNNVKNVLLEGHQDFGKQSSTKKKRKLPLSKDIKHISNINKKENPHGDCICRKPIRESEDIVELANGETWHRSCYERYMKENPFQKHRYDLRIKDPGKDEGVEWLDPRDKKLYEWLKSRTKPTEKNHY